MSKKPGGHVLSAITGRFVSESYVKRHPATTVMEHRKPPKPPSLPKKK